MAVESNTTNREQLLDCDRLARLDTQMMAEQYWGSLKELHADCWFLRRLLREAHERERANYERGRGDERVRCVAKVKHWFGGNNIHDRGYECVREIENG